MAAAALGDALGLLAEHVELVDLSVVDLYTDPGLWPGAVPAAWRGLPPGLDDAALLALARAPFVPGGAGPAPLESFLAHVRACSLPQRFAYEPAAAPSLRRGNERRSAKKRHEVDQLAARVGTLCRAAGCTAAYDFGAGQGYLSAALAGAPWGLQVVALERDGAQCHGSLAQGTSGLHVRQLAVTRDTEPAELGGPPASSCCFCSLHACGSLSANMLRLFCTHAAARVLVNVGCCYNLIEDGDFPLSAQGRALLGALPPAAQRLAQRTSRMLACQAPWRWAAEPTASTQAFRRHHYRALLEAVLARTGAAGRRLGSLPAPALASFEAYAAAAFARLGTPVPGAAVAAVQAQFDTPEWRRRLAFLWTVRALLGPVVEACILLDRVLFLEETLPAGSSVDLVPVFDPETSPRNMAIIALRP